MLLTAVVRQLSLVAVNEEYKQRLSEWVQAELARTEISERQLAKRIGVNYATLQKWRKKMLTQGLGEESVQAIARWRGEPPEQTRAWLEGKNSDLADPLLEDIRVVSVPVLIQALKIGLQRLESLVLDVKEAPMHECTVIALINHELETQKIDRDRFAARAHISPDRLNQVMDDLTEPLSDEDLTAIARGLSYSGRVQWTAEQLRTLMEQQGKADRLESSAS